MGDKIILFTFRLVHFSRSVVSDSLRPQGLKNTRLPCPSPTPGVYPNPCPSSRWCHPAISSSVVHFRWPKYWSFSFSISPSNEYSLLISFRIDRFDLLAVQGTLKGLLQHHNSKTSILQHSAFLEDVQLSHPYMTTNSIDIETWICNCVCYFKY